MVRPAPPASCSKTQLPHLIGTHAFDGLGVVVLQVEGHRDTRWPREAVRPCDNRPRAGRRPHAEDAAPSCGYRSEWIPCQLLEWVAQSHAGWWGYFSIPLAWNVVNLVCTDAA